MRYVFDVHTYKVNKVTLRHICIAFLSKKIQNELLIAFNIKTYKST